MIFFSGEFFEIFKEGMGCKVICDKKNPSDIFHILLTKRNIPNKTRNFSSSTKNFPDFVPTRDEIFYFPHIGQKSFIT
jgi:hypothetical protein